MQIVNMAIDSIKPYERNPRRNEKAVDAVAASIREFGFKVPIVVDSDGVVVAGHTRILAAKKLGITEVPCVIADDLTPEQIKAFRLADNKTAELAEWDLEKLDKELEGLYNIIDMNLFGFPVQIENIDDVEVSGQSEETIARELNELNDYVVLEFETVEDWDRARRLLGVEKVATGEDNPKVRRHGFGRVIKGADVLDKLERLEGMDNEH